MRPSKVKLLNADTNLCANFIMDQEPRVYRPALVCGPYPERETEGGTNQPRSPRSQCRVVLKSPGIGALITKHIISFHSVYWVPGTALNTSRIVAPLILVRQGPILLISQMRKPRHKEGK